MPSKLGADPPDEHVLERRVEPRREGSGERDDVERDPPCRLRDEGRTYPCVGGIAAYAAELAAGRPTSLDAPYVPAEIFAAARSCDGVAPAVAGAPSTDACPLLARDSIH